MKRQLMQEVAIVGVALMSLSPSGTALAARMGTPGGAGATQMGDARGDEAMADGKRAHDKGRDRDRYQERAEAEDEANEQRRKAKEKMKGVAEEDDARPGLEKQREMKMEQERKELGKGSEQGQKMREEHSRKWWRFWE